MLTLSITRSKVYSTFRALSSFSYQCLILPIILYQFFLQNGSLYDTWIGYNSTKVRRKHMHFSSLNKSPNIHYDGSSLSHRHYAAWRKPFRATLGLWWGQFHSHHITGFPKETCGRKKREWKLGTTDKYLLYLRCSFVTQYFLFWFLELSLFILITCLLITHAA